MSSFLSACALARALGFFSAAAIITDTLLDNSASAGAGILPGLAAILPDTSLQEIVAKRRHNELKKPMAALKMEVIRPRRISSQYTGEQHHALAQAPSDTGKQAGFPKRPGFDIRSARLSPACHHTVRHQAAAATAPHRYPKAPASDRQPRGTAGPARTPPHSRQSAACKRPAPAPNAPAAH